MRSLITLRPEYEGKELDSVLLCYLFFSLFIYLLLDLFDLSMCWFIISVCLSVIVISGTSQDACVFTWGKYQVPYVYILYTIYILKFSMLRKLKNYSTNLPKMRLWNELLSEVFLRDAGPLQLKPSQVSAA